MEDFSTIIIVGIALILLILAILISIYLMSWLVVGARHILSWSLEYGFFGLIVLGAAWVFLLPFMIIISLVFGYLILREDATGYAYKEKNKKNSDLPPKDPYQKYLWSNRLPPYDEN